MDGHFRCQLQRMAMMLNKLRNLFLYTKQFCFLHERKSQVEGVANWSWPRWPRCPGRTQRNCPLKILKDFLWVFTFLWSVYRRELMWVSHSVSTGKLSRRRSEWFPEVPSTACRTSGNCKCVCLYVVHVYTLIWNIMNWGGQNTQDVGHPNRREVWMRVKCQFINYSFKIKNGI